MIDNYDSFTYNLYDYFLRIGVHCDVIRNDKTTVAALKRQKMDGLVISPGPKRPEDAGITMDCLAHFHDKLPILGICLGHQAIGLFFGASLVRAREPRHGKTSKIIHDEQHIFKNLQNPLEVMRYHSLILENLPQSLQIAAKTADILGGEVENEIMAISHQHLPIVGVQFHPESILTPHGLAMLKNWCDMI